MANEIEQKHTPGPWKVAPSREGNFLGVYPVAGTATFPIAKMPKYVRAEINGANARLLAAAPDLFDACASVWLMLADTGDNELRLIADECRAAIAKSSGAL